MTKRKLGVEALNALIDENSVENNEKVVGTNALKHTLEQLKIQFVTQEEFNYKPIAINSFTNNKNTVEMGSTITDITLNWSLNKTAKTLTLDNATVTPTDTSKVLSGQSITANKTWTLKATDEKDATATKTTAITFSNGVYWGNKTVPATYDSDFVLTLQKGLQGNKNKTFTVTAGDGEFIYYALPTRYGTPTFNVGGFDGGFTKIATIEFTNSSGYKENYDIYKSDNANLGTQTVLAK